MEHLHLAGCIIKKSDNSILLLHRNTKKRRQWEIPGGKYDPSEEPAKAAIREVRQETGMEVEIVKEVGTHSFEQDDMLITYTWYVAELILDGTPAPQKLETHDRCEFINVKDLHGMYSELSQNVRNILSEIDANRLVL